MTRRESVGLGLAAATLLRSQTRTPYKVAIIGRTGHGGFGHGWDLAWNGVPGVQVVAVSDPDEKGRATARGRSGALRGYADYREMLDRERPQIVTIGLRWSDERLAMFRAAVDIGAHVLVEKPFASCVADADEMTALAARRGVKVQVGHAARASVNAGRLQKMIRDGEIGQVVELRARGKEDQRAGGEDLVVLGTHALDLMRLFAGDPRWVFGHVTEDGREVTRRDGREGGEHVGKLAGNQISATFAFEKGLDGYFATHTASPYPPQNRCGLWIMGTKGAIHINVGNSRSAEARILRSPLWMADKEAQWESLGPEGPETQGTFDRPANSMALDLVDAIERDRPPICTARDGTWTIEMIAGIYQSHFKGAPVSFPLADRRDPFAV